MYGEGIHQTRFKYVVIVTLTLILIDQVCAQECVDVSNPQTRSFATLLDLQSNKESFEPINITGFAGNYVTVQENLENIGRNSFICYGSKYIVKMFLSKRRVKQIEEGAFMSLDCLKALDLRQNLLSVITKQTFEGLPLLEELNLGENDLTEVREHVFNILPRLKVLNLTRNSIGILHRDSFFNMSALEQLDLSYNRLHHFVPDIVKYFRRLVNLQLGSNLLDRMEFEQWDLPRLRTFNLSNNVLVSFDTTYDYNYGTTLKELYLDQNYLTQMNPYGLRKHFPNLSLIDINNNPWSCPHLSPLVTTLKDARVSFRALSTDGGPNVDGIACNRTLDFYTKNKVVDLDAPPQVNSTTTSRSTIAMDLTMEKVLITNVQMLESVKRMHIVVALFFAIVVIFIIIDILVRIDAIGCFMNVKRRIRGASSKNDNSANENVENACLLSDRQ